MAKEVLKFDFYARARKDYNYLHTSLYTYVQCVIVPKHICLPCMRRVNK